MKDLEKRSLFSLSAFSFFLSLDKYSSLQSYPTLRNSLVRIRRV